MTHGPASLTQKIVRTTKVEGQAVSEIAAGFEIGAGGAHELALLLVELCPTIRAGTFDFLCFRGLACVGHL